MYYTIGIVSDKEMNMKSFREIQNISKAVHEKNDCAIIAISILTDIPYETVHNEFTKIGRKQGQAVSIMHMETVLNNLGYIIIHSHVSGPESLLRMVANRTSKFSKRVHIFNKELQSFEILKLFKTLVYTNRHVAALIDGKLIDWSAESKKQKVRHIQFIMKKEDAIRNGWVKVKKEQ